MKRIVLAAFAAALYGGCIQVKTESEIKPIHITMDVNLKVDRELDKAFADENRGEAQGSYKAVKDMLDRGVAGITNRAMLEERSLATDADRILIAEENAKRMKRFGEIAKNSGVTVESVQKRRMEKTRERLQAGCGVWLQEEDGEWRRR
ncbi:MAG: DUF1318 domain-containing protein [Kiritimatiellae bacterium]|nr:DUF1318 domain-containing protein [Kiritimatiellia bacterium]